MFSRVFPCSIICRVFCPYYYFFLRYICADDFVSIGESVMVFMIQYNPFFFFFLSFQF